MRLCHDAKARAEGVSLNSVLHQGPDLANNLTGCLVRFRQDPIALMADIEAHFHQVKVPEADVHVLCFFFWEDGDLTKQLILLIMLGHFFGARLSPCMANFGQKTADDNKNDFPPEVHRTVHKNFMLMTSQSQLSPSKRQRS
jgi:hypothetical protein